MDKNQQISDKKLNDKPMTTSASSEIFDSWTLVTEKNVPPSAETAENMRSEDDVSDDTANRVEILKTSTIANDDDVSKTSLVEVSEDLSDGISIISDSDSVGRLSPNKFLHLASDVYEPIIDLKGNDDLPDTSSVHTNVCERSSQTSVSTKSQQQQQQQQQQVLKNRKRRSSRSSSLQVDRPVDDSERTCSFPAIRCGLTSFFYVAVLLAVLAFIGKLRYPEWQPLVKSSELNELEARLIDLELQNNLLRAEFDILSKHVAYVSERNGNQPRFKCKGDAASFSSPPPQQQQQQPSSRRKPNRPNSSGAPPRGANNDNRQKFESDFRAWPDDIDGDGDSPAFACNQEEGNCFRDSNTKPPGIIAPGMDNIDDGAGGDDAIPNQVPPRPNPSSPDNFNDMQFSQRRNSKPSFGSGQKMGKNSFKKHSGERFDSRENFQRHDKPMKHQKPQDDYRFKKHPDQQYRHHHRSSNEDHNEDHSRERNRYHQQRRTSNAENDKNHYRNKQPQGHDNKNNKNWYIARGDDREQTRAGSGIHSR